ncbi:hypothetical protein ACQP1P_35430 [Dactylosporangium sp. CA-052675]|uniref:hypothetical protein n=1 Tax=Dactylosporangium sp. CA-052675 TaxID=3239927 RepID=UPI003D91EE2C
MRLLVVLLCAAALVQAARPAVHSTRVGVTTAVNTDLSDPDRRYREQLEYLSDEFARQVPAGTRVVIIEDHLEWQLRLRQLATLHGIVVVLGSAEVEVRLEFDQTAPHGIRLVTRKAVDG